MTPAPAFFRKRIENQQSQPRVSVLVPAYQASGFIVDTLDSLEQQSYQSYDLHISIDKSDDKTDHVVSAWCDERPHLHANTYLQENRLGWVRNVNFLIGKCTNQHFIVLPHDDLLHRHYLGKLVACLQQNTEASVAYTDIKRIGHSPKIISQPSIKGSRCERVVEFLRFHFNAVAFRGLVNKTVMSELLYLSEGDLPGFAIDTVWTLQMAIQGPMVRVPQVHYSKRTTEASARDLWQKTSDDDKVKAWLAHCLDCRDVISRAGFNTGERAHLLDALQDRLLQRYKKLCYRGAISRLTKEEQGTLIALLKHEGTGE